MKPTRASDLCAHKIRLHTTLSQLLLDTLKPTYDITTLLLLFKHLWPPSYSLSTRKSNKIYNRDWNFAILDKETPLPFCTHCDVDGQRVTGHGCFSSCREGQASCGSLEEQPVLRTNPILRQRVRRSCKQKRNKTKR